MRLMVISLLLSTYLYSLRVAALPQPQAPQSMLAPIDGLQYDNVVQDHYVVHFKKGYTLAEHIKLIGKDVTAWPRFYKKDYLPGYSAVIEQDVLNSDVRADPGVELVEADRYVVLDDTTLTSTPIEKFMPHFISQG